MGLSSSLPEPVRLPLPFPIGRVNAWLLRGDPLTLVDAGARWDEGMPALEAALSTHGVRIDDVELLVLTHHHDDHAGLAHDVRERSGCQVAAHVATAERLADVPCHRAVEDVWQVALLRLHGAGEETTATVAEVTAKAAGWQASVLVDRVLEDGDVLRAGDHELEVLLRPGHSPTDTLFVARAGWALLGDHLLAPSASAVLAERPRGVDDPRLRLRALPRYREGLRKTAAQGLSEGFAGHGAAIDDPAALVETRLDEQDRRAQAVLDGMSSGATTAWDLLRSLWPGRDLSSDRHPVSIPYVVLCDMLGFLDLLVADGRVAEHDAGDRVVFERI